MSSAGWAIAVAIGLGVAVGADNLDNLADQSGRASLPDRLTNQEFWRLTQDLSEPAAPFISDNLVSNEASFAQVVPQLEAWVQPGGVYIGVGPEQNFTYLATTRARMGFILDLRRENLLLHLLYKALFGLSPDRQAFVARLFSRPRSDLPREKASVSTIIDVVSHAAPGSPASFEANLAEVRSTLVDRYHLPLSTEDLAVIERAYRAMFVHGPAIGYATTLTGMISGPAAFANLMKQADERGRGLSFLATESSYQFIRDLQQRNLVIPVVGNFSGPTALRRIGAYVRDRGATVATFYVSNVEDYLTRERQLPRDNGDWNNFCRNAASLPIEDRSVLVRPWGLALAAADGSVTMGKDMQLSAAGFRDAVILQPSQPLPPALWLMSAEARLCQ